MRNYWSRFLRRAAAYHDIWWPPNTILFLRILAVLAVSPLLVRFDLPRLKRLIEPRRVRRAGPAKKTHSTERVERIIRYTDGMLANRGPMMRKNCFRRAITLYYFLRREGMELDLCFGVKTPDESVLDGHCWLVRDESPYLELNDPTSMFTPVYSFSQITPMKADG